MRCLSPSHRLAPFIRDFFKHGAVALLAHMSTSDRNKIAQERSLELLEAAKVSVYVSTRRFVRRNQVRELWYHQLQEFHSALASNVVPDRERPLAAANGEPARQPGGGQARDTVCDEGE